MLVRVCTHVQIFVQPATTTYTIVKRGHSEVGQPLAFSEHYLPADWRYAIICPARGAGPKRSDSPEGTSVAVDCERSNGTARIDVRFNCAGKKKKIEQLSRVGILPATRVGSRA